MKNSTRCPDARCAQSTFCGVHWENGTTTFLVDGGTKGIRNRERRVALARALRLLHNSHHASSRLRPPKLVTETLQQLFDWVASERECEKVAEGASTMTMLDEAKPNGHAEPAMRAWDARLAAIERRLAALPAEIAETSEQRIVILRDADRAGTPVRA